VEVQIAPLDIQFNRHEHPQGPWKTQHPKPSSSRSNAAARRTCDWLQTFHRAERHSTQSTDGSSRTTLSPSTTASNQRTEVPSSETSNRAARQQLANLQEQRSRIEVKASQTEMRKENIRTHVSQRYQLDLEAFKPDTYALIVALRERSQRKAETPEGEQPAAEAPEETERPAIAVPAEGEGIPWDRIEELVAELTERIDSMGPVSMDAIQEYDELEQRYIFLEKQNADLVTSKAERLEVISKINNTTKTLFAETFEKIRENFQFMFTELFGGGRANLLLTDDSDPLESGIEIIAKPPGKQIQCVTLLSGGERTMTAVSLLFAIYMVKPSPFCVLDEMDAPLDESNITRFIKILDRFVGQSQLVTITHNKRTISRADLLYGVTMEEHGVSKLVSVKFSGKTDDNSKSSESVAKALGKSENLASGKEASGDSVAVLLKRSFHFIQINGGGKSRGVCGAHRAETSPLIRKMKMDELPEKMDGILPSMKTKTQGFPGPDHPLSACEFARPDRASPARFRPAYQMPRMVSQGAFAWDQKAARH